MQKVPHRFWKVLYAAILVKHVSFDMLLKLLFIDYMFYSLEVGSGGALPDCISVPVWPCSYTVDIGD